ncbi:MAG: type VI secretion system protein TssL [Gammaproteobacteria bacterium]|nr:type VI secretion system protein TssL [Gammaproteobacteria bacterium]
MDNESNTIIKPRPKKGANQDQPALTDRTIVAPRPRPGGAMATPTPSDSTVITPRKTRAQNLPLSINAPKENEILKQSPLIDAAGALLSLTPQLRQLEGKVDVNNLHHNITLLVRNFHREMSSKIADIETQHSASYVLCSLIDETVLNTPWGENSAWSQKPLLSVYHKETYGGEKVYNILDEAMITPSKNHELIELIYLSFSLGFMGKLRIDPQGSVKIEQLLGRTYDALKKSRDRYKNQLSKNISPATGLKHKLHSLLPAWLFVASLTLVAFGIFNYWLFDLNKKSDAISSKLAALTPVETERNPTTGESRAEVIALRQLLAPEIERNLLSVDDYITHTSIVLHAEELFSSGSTDIAEAFHPVLSKIAKALESIQGRIIVAGHTDNIAIRTPRFPSNWHLSLARANAVVQYMSETASLKARLLPEGHGENEPVSPNTSPTGRAKNRRVAINIYHTKNNAWQGTQSELVNSANND